MNHLKHQAVEKLEQPLGRVPFIKFDEPPTEAFSGDRGPDFQVNLRAFGRSLTLVRNLSTNGQPHQVRYGLFQLRSSIANNKRNLAPIFIAPNLSSDFRALCREHEVGFF